MPAAITDARGQQIGAISERTGVNIETIRFYERIGVLPKPQRSGGGHRIYSVAHESRLTFIKRSRELGFSLDEVRTLIGLADADNGNCAEVFHIARKHLDDVREKLDDLRRIERVLQSLVTACADGSLPDCPIIEAISDRKLTKMPGAGRTRRLATPRREP